ncbi:CCE_0567 family metalloprotein [Vibrio sp.]|uniref:Rop family plasmid primer RNA-binding protein n=1 Tax=Vibrio viridaestus TaxID=2487322 RepID=A0A3N9TMD1_9VIBR|nr:CCE_0567 family metalloprotein [Vibrio viridaestus]MDC0612488.1 CCE_0567 family metalloprotein [Vibrio sp.]RQW65003.1 hypothetical protein EES38_02935 [Vibrio viridaestus]
MMSQGELEQLRNDITLAKHLASEKVEELQRLIEGELPNGYDKLPRISYECYQACKHFTDLTDELQSIETSTAA